MKGSLVLLMLTACASAPLVTAPVRLPAHHVAVIGYATAPPYDDEDFFLDLVGGVLQRRGVTELEDERALRRESSDLLDYLKRTDAEVVVRVSAPNDNCWLRDTDDDSYQVECITTLTVYEPHGGGEIADEQVSGFGNHADDEAIATGRAIGTAAIRAAEAFDRAELKASLRPDPQDDLKLAAAKARAGEIGKTAINTPQGLSFVLIPAGTFTMGCTRGDDQCEDNEKPPRDVTIEKPFYLAFTPTTNFQYQKCVDAGACHATADMTRRLEPVVKVSWDDAREYCAWAGGRLPTEAEWEYAARGGVDGWRFPWGNEAGRDNANFADNGGRRVEYIGIQASPDVARFLGLTFPYGGSSPVATFEKNGFALYDMAGNVAQWTAGRVLRGGSWGGTGGAGRVSARYLLAPETRLDTIGFRCARSFALQL